MSDPVIPFLSDNSPRFNGWLDGIRAAMPDANIVPFADLTPEQKLEADVAILIRPSAEQFTQLPNLKWVQCVAAGVDSFIDTVRDVTFPVVRLVDPGMTKVMSEGVLAWSLYLHRDMPYYAQQQRKNTWAPKNNVLPEERRISILGMGELGRVAAQRLKANHFDVMGWSRSDKQSMCDWPTTHGPDGLTSILNRSDIIVLLMPLTTETKGMVNDQFLAKLPKGASIINFCRGPIIDTDAMVRALDSGQLDHAVLDVFDKEPLGEDSPLWKHPSVTILPHISGRSTPKSASKIVASNIDTFRKTGKIPETVVDFKRGY